MSRVALGVLGSLISGGLAIAQTEDADTRIEEVVVTARKIEESVQDIPVAVTAFSGAALERQNVREVRDLASKAPSLNFGQGGSSTAAVNPQIRGQTQPENILTTDAAVALYVDNVVLPRNYGLRQAMVDISRIEVLRGPQGTLYGKNTTGGLINILTNDPGPEFGASLSASYASYDTVDLKAILNVPLGDNAGLRLVGSHFSHDPYGRDLSGRPLAQEEDYYVRGKFHGEWDRLSVNAFASYGSISTGGIYLLAGLVPAVVNASGVVTAPEGGNLTREAALELFGADTPAAWAQALPIVRQYIGGVNGDSRRTGGTFTRPEENYSRDVGLDLSYDFANDMTVRSITGYRSLAFGYPSDLDSTPFVGTHPRRAAQDDFISQELQLLGGDQTLNWVVGAYGSWEHGKEYSTTSTLPLRLNPTRPTILNVTDGKMTSESWAVFAQANWRFAEQWALTVGARYTSDTRGLVSYNRTMLNGAVFSCSVPVSLRTDPNTCQGEFEDTFEEPTWTASLTYEPTADITAYAKASHGFRSGGQNYRGSGTVESFQAFKPETVNEYEAGLKTTFFDQSVRLNLAAFYDEITDVQRAIILVASTGQTFTVQTNAASATIKGVEVEGTWRITPDLTLDAAYSVIDPEYEEFRDFSGDRSGEDWPTPKTQYNVAATYVLPLSFGDLTSTVNYSYQGRRNLVPASKNRSQVTQPGFGLLNARVSLNIDSQDFSVSLFGRNLTDEEYYAAGVGLESVGWNTVVLGEPRIWGVELVKRFGGI